MLPPFCGQLLRQSVAHSVLLLFSGQFDCYEAEESPVERAWFKLDSALSYLLLDANLSSPAGNGKEVENPGKKTWL